MADGRISLGVASRRIVEMELTRDWPCAGCTRKIRTGETVHVHIIRGVPHNQVFHPACAPQLGSVRSTSG
jgi:hypothetical protein